MEKQSLEYQAKNNVMEKLIKLTEKYPDKNWDWNRISNNPNITIEVIEKYPDKPWDWNKILEVCSFEKDYEIELQKLQNFKNIEEELIQKTWHPSRFQEWCLDEDQKEDEEE